MKNNPKFGLDGCLEMMGTTSLKSNSPCSPHCILSGNWLPLGGAALLLTVQFLTEKVHIHPSAGLEVHLSQKRLLLCTVLALEVLSALKVAPWLSAALK